MMATSLYQIVQHTFTYTYTPYTHDSAIHVYRGRAAENSAQTSDAHSADRFSIERHYGNSIALY